ncbi:Uma2 family endonuclease [Terrarubrum flagellatum]|uniref:Uma2 family endonuclease n=1 Tax=Terrirubrum flagellatum TaxID=2895980 RepID=UPI00314504A6
MSTLPKQRMTVDEFLVWAEGRPGRYELEAGEVIAMSPERARHAEGKFECQTALRSAIRRAGLPCFMMPDGMTVRIADDVAYEPDALVYCGERLQGDRLEVPNPVIIVEVVSPSTGSVDKGKKLSGYFSLASVRHYLLVDPDKRLITHHARASSDLIETRILSSGPLRLDPPGLHLSVEEMFPEA